jgi:branched-chain amino acid transport system permease protein
VAPARALSAGEDVIDRLLSGDRPRSRVLAALLVLLLVCLAFAPFLFPGTRSLAVAARICVFIVLAASYDMLLGYTGIVSFAHTMFFGIGAYGVAIALAKFQVGWDAVLLGTGAGLALAVALAAAIGLLGLRVRAIFFSMITLAVASFALLFATQFREITGGEDGLTFAVPRALTPAYRLLPAPVLGVRIDGRILTYYLVFASALVLFLLMLRIVNSPFGRVLQAIRENEFRAEALGYRTVVYRTIASAIAAGIAALAGALMALLMRYNGPEATLSFALMVDVLLMVVIGGMGTLYGAALGATLVVLAQYYLQAVMGTLSEALAPVPLLAALFHPDRWLLWLGALFVLTVYFFPAGIVGKLRETRHRLPPPLAGEGRGGGNSIAAP